MNQKGITLVELLAAIVIMGIMSTLAIASVSGILHKSRVSYYATLKSDIILAAKSYYADHRGALPRLTGEKRRLDVKTLVDTKYLDSAPKSHDKNYSCVNNSYIEVEKVDKSKYDYKITLECGNIPTDLINQANY